MHLKWCVVWTNNWNCMQHRNWDHYVNYRINQLQFLIIIIIDSETVLSMTDDLINYIVIRSCFFKTGSPNIDKYLLCVRAKRIIHAARNVPKNIDFILQMKRSYIKMHTLECQTVGALTRVLFRWVRSNAATVCISVGGCRERLLLIFLGTRSYNWRQLRER